MRNDSRPGQEDSPTAEHQTSNVKATWTVLSMMEWATDYFTKHQVDQPRLSIEWLLADVLNIPRLNLYLQFDRPLTSLELDTLRPMVKRRASHEPLQYICGKGAFMSRDFMVSPSVLIPRSETEELVSMILKDNPEGSSLRVLDIGTGSGCIITTLAAERPSWECYGIDISSEALDVARENAQLYQANVNFFGMDLFELAGSGSDLAWTGSNALKSGVNFPETFDLIVSNPPYIHPDEAASMDPQVLNYEPSLALFAEDPLKVIDAILTYAGRALSEHGRLYCELNPAYTEQIYALSLNYLRTSEVRLDDAGKLRFLTGQK